MELKLLPLVVCLATLGNIKSDKMCPCDLYFEPEPKCVFEEAEGGLEIERMTCYPIGTDDRNLGEILQQTPAFSSKDAISSSPKGFAFDESTKPKGLACDLAPKVKELRLNLAGNVKIDDNDLNNFTNLENLFVFGGRYRRPNSPVRNYRLHIDPNGLKTLPKLQNVRLVDHLELPPPTLDALGTVKDKVTSLSVWDSTPAEAITNLTSSFNKLKALDFVNKRNPSKCSENMFQGSAPSLKRIHLQGCNNTHLPANMFRGLNNLKTLRLADSGFTSVEPGAFDDLPKLEGLHILGNKIRRLPSGVFSKLPNLQFADFSGSRIENLSDKNFTASKNFDQLSSAPQCCPCRE